MAAAGGVHDYAKLRAALVAIIMNGGKRGHDDNHHSPASLATVPGSQGARTTPWWLHRRLANTPKWSEPEDSPLKRALLRGPRE